MLGVNVSALLLPAGVALAFAAKDLSHNFLAGFFLIMVQPFRQGGVGVADWLVGVEESAGLEPCLTGVAVWSGVVCSAGGRACAQRAAWRAGASSAKCFLSPLC